MATQPVTKITEEEYLQLERAASRKSEFIYGQIVAMAGGSLPHALLAGNFISEFNLQLRGRNCRVFSSDAKVRTSFSGSYVYPDLSVLCGRPALHKGAHDILTNPTVVVEVLSPSTIDYDHRTKFKLYREIPSLTDYILAHPDQAWVEQFTRQADGSWLYRDYDGVEAEITVASLGCQVRLSEAYAGVLDFPDEPDTADSV